MKFLDSFYNKYEGKSIVTLADKYGIYTGYAKVHPLDKENASEYAGCAIAESRAWIKALKSRRRRTKIKLNTIEEVIKDINLNANNYIDVSKRLNILFKKYTKEIKEIDKNIEEINNSIKKRLEARKKILDKQKKDSQE